jgi:hypothetical protein
MLKRIGLKEIARCGEGAGGGPGGGGSSAPTSSPRPQARPENLANISRARQQEADFVENALNSQGLTQDKRFASYKNVDPITGETYSPMSPTAREAAARATSAFAQTDAGRNLAMQEAIGAFGDRTRGAAPIDPGLIAAATGRTPGLTKAEIAEAQRELGKALGQGALAPNATWDRPLGDLMAPTLSGAQGLLGTNVKSSDYFDNLSRGYNRATGGFLGIGGQDLAVDPFGNVGFNTLGQRIGQGIVNKGLPIAAGLVNPALGILASGLQSTQMTPYSNMLGSTSTLSYDVSRPVQGAAFMGLASAAAPAIARSVFDGTNASQAMMMGTAGGVALGSAGAALAGNLAGRVFDPVQIGGNANAPGGQPASPAAVGGGISSMRGSDIAEGGGGGAVAAVGDGGAVADSGFGARVAGGGSQDGSLGSPQNSAQPAAADRASIVPPNMASDFAAFEGIPGQEGPAGSPQQPNAISGFQPVDLAGNDAANMESNPMFFQTPAGVQYLLKGRQRDTGNVTYARTSPRDAFSSERRGSIGNRLLNFV